MVHRPLCHHRGFVSGVHPVGAAAGSATGVGCGRRHRRPARSQRVGLGHRLVHGQRLPRLEQSACPPRRPRTNPRRHPPAAGPEKRNTCRRRIAAGCGRPGAAGRGRAVVGVVAGTSRYGRPVLETTASRRRTRPGARAGAADRRLARPVSTAVAPAVPAAAGPGRRRGADHRSVDTHPAALAGSAHRRRGNARLAGHPPRRPHGRIATQQGSRLRRR
jgi:hypothetical protein